MYAHGKPLEARHDGLKILRSYSRYLSILRSLRAEAEAEISALATLCGVIVDPTLSG